MLLLCRFKLCVFRRRFANIETFRYSFQIITSNQINITNTTHGTTFFNQSAPVKSLLSSLLDRRQALTAMRAMQFDVTKLPLGALSLNVVEQAFQLLSALETALSSALVSTATVLSLSTRFYTLVPHTFASGTETFSIVVFHLYIY